MSTGEAERAGGPRLEARGVERERIYRRHPASEMEPRDGRIDAESRQRRFLDRRHRLAGQRRQILAAQIEIVLASQLGGGERVVLEQRSEIEPGRSRAAPRAILRR